MKTKNYIVSTLLIVLPSLIFHPVTLNAKDEMTISAKHKTSSQNTVVYKKGKSNRKAIKKINKLSSKYLGEIYKSYKEKKYVKHAELSLGYLKYYNNIPMELLNGVNSQLVKKVRKDGVRPYLSIVVEFMHRAAFSPTKESKPTIARLKKHIVKRKYMSGYNKKGKYITVLRSINRKNYRPYSENAGLLAMILMASEYKKGTFQSRFAAESYLRVANNLYICNNKNDEEKKESPICNRLVDAIADNFENSGQANSNFNDMTTLVDMGITSGLDDCISSLSDNAAQGMIDYVDQITSCRQNESSGTPRFDPFGSMMTGSANDYYDRATDAYTTKTVEDILKDKGFKKEGNAHMDTIMGPSGNDFYFDVQQDFTNDNGDTASVTHVQDDDGNNHTGVVVHHSGGGASYMNFENGMPTSGGYNDPSTGESYRAEYNDNGTLKSETFTDKNGTESVVTYNENGDCVSNCDSTGANTGSNTASTPPDDYATSECAAVRAGQFQEWVDEHTPAVSRLDTLIIPAPDSAKGDSNICFSQFGGGNSPNTRNCKSVAMCLNGYVLDENCRCSPAGGGGQDVPFASSACSQIMCPDGKSCDPATGTCIGQGGGVDIGESSPIPLPIITESLNSIFTGNVPDLSRGMRGFGSTNDY